MYVHPLLTGGHKDKRYPTNISHFSVKCKITSLPDNLMSPLNNAVQYSDTHPQYCMSNAEISNQFIRIM